MVSRIKAPIDVQKVIRKRRERIETRRGYGSLLFRLAVVVIVGYLIFTQVFLLTQAQGTDMFPMVKDGDLMIVFRMQREYNTKDVVVYTQDGKQHTGRIVARENDVVDMDEDGSLTVNGTTQSGEILYPTYPKDGITYPYRVTAGCVFVLGDYRTEAEDSRDFGPIPMENVHGKVITILRRRGL